MLHFKLNISTLFFRFLLLLFVSKFLYLEGNGQVYTIDTLLRNGERSNRINLVYLGEGFTGSEVTSLLRGATANNNALFAQNPFTQYKSFFNAYSLNSISPESGAKHPGNATDELSSNNQPIVSPNNLFNTTFDFGGIHRLLVPINTSKIFQVLAQHVPEYNQAILITNSTYYGGSGGVVATTSMDNKATEVAIHEIGHSFADLADEYWAGDNYARERPNMTQNTDPATVKWKNWYNINSVGIYQHGTLGISAAWYKPHQSCKMQTLFQPFCAVCSERIIDRIHELVNMMDGYTPTANAFTLPNSDPAQFTIRYLQNTPSSIGLKWYLNGNLIADVNNQSTLSIPYERFLDGENLVRAAVTDNTPQSKSFLPSAGYVNNQVWTITKPSVLPLHLKAFSGRVVNKSAVLNWEIDNARDLSHFELEKSKDGRNFTLAAKVSSQALSSQFNYTDQSMYLPFSYYRLRAIEKNGSVINSSIIRLQNAFEKLAYKVYQDADLRTYHLGVSLNNKENISLVIVNAAGKQVFRKSFGITEQQLEYDVNLQDKPAGIYFMKIMVGNNNYTVQLLAK